MSLARLFEEPDLSGLEQVRFSDSDAWEKMKIVRRYSFDDGASSAYRLVIHHSTGWVEFTYTIAQETEALPDSIRQYIESIQIDEPKKEAPSR